MKPGRQKAGDSRPAGAVITVRIQPRASKNGHAVQADGSVKIRLTAPPVDGAANEALVRYLAEIFHVAKSQVEILSGHTGRQKIVRVSGVLADDARRMLNTAR